MAERNKDDMTVHLPTDELVWTKRHYEEIYNESIEDNKNFWAKQARKLHWYKTWDKVLEWDAPYAKWFVGGKLNASYECVDRHAKTRRRNKVAIYWEGENGDTEVLSYATLFRNVNMYASVLKNLGIKKGDKVAIYLPMIPALPAFMLACARIGATHTVIFSGLSAQSIADRVNDCNAKMIITSDGGFRRGKILDLKKTVDAAADLCPNVEKVLVVKRTGNEVAWDDKRDVWLSEELENAESYIDPEPVESTHPLYILYTSGTTGKPKGIVHGTGGYLVYNHATYEWAFNMREDSVFWCTADIGWVTGHSYTVYGPLSHGAAIVLYEGAPDFPNTNRWWDIIDKYGVNVFYTSPTAIRMFMKFGDDWLKKHDLSTLELLGSVGEAINPEAWWWYYKNIGKCKCPIIDTWWQTETGGFMISPAVGIEDRPLKPGSATFPMPGIEAKVVDADGKEMPDGETGFLIITKPWPGMLLGVNNEPELYQKTYWSRFPGNYYPGDYAMKDKDGYLWLLGRADEVLMVAGHRIGTIEIEDVAVSHPAVTEAAVTGKADEVKGEAIVLFVTLKQDYEASEDLQKSIIQHVRKVIGPMATPEDVFFVDQLPKTRSGKIMRRLLKAVAAGEKVGDTTTLDDEGSIRQAEEAFGKIKKLSK